MTQKRCRCCGQLIPDPVGRPESEAVRKAVDVVEAGKMNGSQAAKKFGVTRQAVSAAWKRRRERASTSET